MFLPSCVWNFRLNLLDVLRERGLVDAVTSENLREGKLLNMHTQT